MSDNCDFLPFKHNDYDFGHPYATNPNIINNSMNKDVNDDLFYGVDSLMRETDQYVYEKNKEQYDKNEQHDTILEKKEIKKQGPQNTGPPNIEPQNVESKNENFQTCEQLGKLVDVLKQFNTYNHELIKKNDELQNELQNKNDAHKKLSETCVDKNTYDRQTNQLSQHYNIQNILFIILLFLVVILLSFLVYYFVKS